MSESPLLKVYQRSLSNVLQPLFAKSKKHKSVHQLQALQGPETYSSTARVKYSIAFVFLFVLHNKSSLLDEISSCQILTNCMPC